MKFSKAATGYSKTLPTMGLDKDVLLMKFTKRLSAIDELKTEAENNKLGFEKTINALNKSNCQGHFRDGV